MKIGYWIKDRMTLMAMESVYCEGLQEQKKNPFIVNLYILFQISFKLVFALNLIALMKSMFKM